VDTRSEWDSKSQIKYQGCSATVSHTTIPYSNNLWEMRDQYPGKLCTDEDQGVLVQPLHSFYAQRMETRDVLQFFNYACCDSWGKIDQCENRETEWASAGNKKDTWRVQYLDRHAVYCNEGEVMTDFHWNWRGSGSNKEPYEGQYDYNCCKPADESTTLACSDYYSTASEYISETDWTSLSGTGGVVSCGASGGVLRGFEMESLGTTFRYKYSCCKGITGVSEETCADTTTFDNKWGQWMPLAYSNSNWDVSFEVSYSTSSESITGESVSSAMSISSGASIGFEFGGIGASVSGSLDTESAKETERSVSEIVNLATSKEYQFELDQKGVEDDGSIGWKHSMLWQWRAFLNGPCGSVTVQTQHLATTPSVFEPPCCGPSSHIAQSSGAFDYRDCPADVVFRQACDSPPCPVVKGCEREHHSDTQSATLLATNTNSSADDGKRTKRSLEMLVAKYEDTEKEQHAFIEASQRKQRAFITATEQKQHEIIKQMKKMLK